MVVDVYRMINAKGKSKEDPMARFNKMDDPKDGFKARWDLPQVCVLCGVCVCVCERERERERARGRNSEREQERERKTERKRKRERVCASVNFCVKQ